MDKPATRTLKGVDWIEALRRGIRSNDEAAIRSLFHPDFVMYEDEGLPYGGVFHGADGFLKVQRAAYGTWRDMTLDRKAVLETADGATFAIIYHMKGRPGADDRLVETYLNEVWTVRDGLAVEARVWYWNTNHLAQIMRTASP